jgi:hypothetical protein
VKLLDSFPEFHVTRRFITEFTIALHLSLSWARPVRSTAIYLIFLRYILSVSTYLRLVLPSGLFLLGFPTSSLMFSLFILCSTHPPLLHHSNYTWRRVYVTKLLIMQFLCTLRNNFLRDINTLLLIYGLPVSFIPFSQTH